MKDSDIESKPQGESQSLRAAYLKSESRLQPGFRAPFRACLKKGNGCHAGPGAKSLQPKKMHLAPMRMVCRHGPHSGR